MDFGRRWQLVHDNVMPGRFYWYDYMAPIFECFRTVIDCNLHNDSVGDPMLSEGSCDLMSKSDPSRGSRARSWLHPCHVDLMEYCFFFYSANMTCCFCCHCHLVISTARAQGSEYWCEPVYPCLSCYVSNPSVFFLRGKKGHWLEDILSTCMNSETFDK